MRLIVIKLLLFSLLIPFRSVSQSSDIRVAKPFVSCVLGKKLINESIPMLTHFKVKKSSSMLSIDFLNTDLQKEEKEFFESVIACMNEKELETFPDSVIIVNYFLRNSDRVSKEIKASNRILISEYIKRNGLSDPVLIGTTVSAEVP